VLWIGTSGFAYRDWRRVFYPAGLPSRAWLGYSAQVFRTCERSSTRWTCWTSPASRPPPSAT